MTALLTALLAFFVAAASPGPATLAQAQVALAHGRGAALRFGSGLAFGLAVWGAVAAFGVGAVLVQSAAALWALKVVGGAYLLWLAFKSARSALNPTGTTAPKLQARAWFQGGLLLNLANPKAVLAWIAVLAVALPDTGSDAVLILATLACCCLGWVIYAGYAVIFSVPGARRIYDRSSRIIDGVAAAFFGIFGLRLIFGRLPS